jgi:hypothetical protein
MKRIEPDPNEAEIQRDFVGAPCVAAHKMGNHHALA